ncbi:MAG: hypothetical protein QM699_13565 [Amaricoccus sp.]|uniref:hypothetical protein n=1 Tax=Amaricoccus sp. TaxID=1872485 RepID=UPI0039E4C1DA
MTTVRAYPFARHLVIDRGAAAPLLLLDPAGRAIWESLDAGDFGGDVPEAVRAARIPALADPSPAAPRLRRARWPRRRTYAFAGPAVVLDCADEEILDLMHPRLAHAETQAPAAATLHLRRTATGFALIEQGRPPEHHHRAEALVGAVVRRLVEIGAGRADWAAVLHAAAVADGAGGAIVLPGACGRGKSTLTAALVGAGAAYLSDDCVPLDALGRAVAVPFSLCLKQSGWAAGEAVLPASAAAPVFHCAERGPCRYVAPPRVAARPLPLTAFVFPSYAEGARLTLAPMPPEETLAALVAGRAWLARDPAGLATALAAIERTPAWRLGYGSTADALSAIGDITAARHAAE